MRELIVVTGAKGSGKSTALATLSPPGKEKKVFVLDTENSMSDIVDQIDFGKYIRVYEQYNPDATMLDQMAKGELPWVTGDQRSALVRLYEWFIETLSSELKPGKYETVLIDTIEPIEAAMAAAVDFGKGKFGWSGSKAYGRMETEGVRPLYENMLEAIFSRGVNQIAISTHIKQVWQDDKPVINKIKPGGRLAVLTRLSSLMLWLVPNVGNPDGSPAALVLKARRGKVVAVDGVWQTHRILPQRIPSFSWENVKAYEENPADLANPLEGEIPTQGERDMISEMLTDEQMKLMVVGAQLELEERKQPQVITGPNAKNNVDDEEIKKRVAEGAKPVDVAREFNVSLPHVVAVTRS